MPFQWYIIVSHAATNVSAMVQYDQSILFCDITTIDCTCTCCTFQYLFIFDNLCKTIVNFTSVAVIGGFTGQEILTYYYALNELTHTNDISLRFMTRTPNAFLFQTHADRTEDFLRGEIENGRLKITIRIDGREKVH